MEIITNRTDKKMNIKKLLLLPLLLLGITTAAYAGGGTKDDIENLYKYRVGANFDIKLLKGLSLDISPELRYEEGFDRFMLNGGLSYKTFGCIYWGASYRMELWREEASNSSGFGTSYDLKGDYRYAFDVTYKDRFGRFTPSVRVRYLDYSDEDITDEAAMRYRAKVAYDIPKCKFTPSISVEMMQELEDNMLYKMRYCAEGSYEFSKHSSVSLEYKLDYFLLKYRNTHIFSASYNYKF